MKKLLWSLIAGCALVAIFLYARRQKRSAGQAARGLSGPSEKEMMRRRLARGKGRASKTKPPVIPQSPLKKKVSDTQPECPGGVCPIVKALQRKGRA